MGKREEDEVGVKLEMATAVMEETDVTKQKNQNRMKPSYFGCHNKRFPEITGEDNLTMFFTPGE